MSREGDGGRHRLAAPRGHAPAPTCSALWPPRHWSGHAPFFVREKRMPPARPGGEPVLRASTLALQATSRCRVIERSEAPRVRRSRMRRSTAGPGVSWIRLNMRARRAARPSGSGWFGARAQDRTD